MFLLATNGRTRVRFRRSKPTALNHRRSSHRRHEFGLANWPRPGHRCSMVVSQRWHRRQHAPPAFCRPLTIPWNQYAGRARWQARLQCTEPEMLCVLPRNRLGAKTVKTKFTIKMGNDHCPGEPTELSPDRTNICR